MKNEYEFRGDVTCIFIRRKNGKVVEALIDTEDFHLVENFTGSWYVSHSKWTGDSFYVKGRVPLGSSKYKHVCLHRWVMNVDSELQVDHINGDTLDNRKCNLREVTVLQNQQNRHHANKNNKSCNSLGISLHKHTQKWEARLTINGKRIRIGLFSSIEEAQDAMKKARSTYMKHSQEALQV